MNSDLCEHWTVPGRSLTAGDIVILACHPTQFSTWDSSANPLNPSESNLWKTGPLLPTKWVSWSCDQWTQHGHLEETTTVIIFIIRKYTCLICGSAAGREGMPSYFCGSPLPSCHQGRNRQGSPQASFTLRKCTPEYPLSLGPGAAGCKGSRLTF